jgi:hypothetical protein
MTEVMERYKPEMVTAHDGVLYIRFVPDDAGAWVMHHQATALQARVAELEGLIRAVHCNAKNLAGDRTFDQCITALGHIDDLCRAALEGKKDE